MSFSSGRGQTEPLAVLFAVLVIGAGLALYAGVLEEALDGEPARDVATPTLERVEGHLTPDGVVRPALLSSVDEATPSGYAVNVTIETADDRRWTWGKSPPPDADSARRPVSVRTAPATIRRGTLRVVTWT